VESVEDGMKGFSLLDPLVLGSSVLEPDLDLGVGQAKVIGQLAALQDGQVLGPPELGFQDPQLLVGEGSSGLPVCLVLLQVTSQRAHWEAVD